MNRSFTCNYFAHFPRKCHPEGWKFCKAKLWLSNGCKFCEKHLNQWPRPHKYHVQFLSAPLKINDTTQKREGVGLVVLGGFTTRQWLPSSPQAVLMLCWYANRAIITTLLLFITETLRSWLDRQSGQTYSDLIKTPQPPRLPPGEAESVMVKTEPDQGPPWLSHSCADCL